MPKPKPSKQFVPVRDQSQLAARVGSKITKGKNGKGVILGLADAIGHQDHWQNRATGLGMRGQDKRISGGVGITIPFREFEVEEILTASPIARRLVELPGKHALRKGFQITGVDPKIRQKIVREYKRIKLFKNFKIGGDYARTYGGSGLLMSVDDGLDVKEPLDLSRIRRFNGLIPLTRWELWTQFTELETNINNPNFNFPKRYYLQPRRGLPFEFENVTSANPLTGIVENLGKAQTLQYNSPIHYSRIIRFDGKWLPVRKRAQNVYWDDSVFTSLWDAMRDYSITHGYLANIIADFSMAVMKIESIQALLSAEGGDQQVQAFLEMMAMYRNLLGAIVCGKDDSYEWQSRTVTGLPEVVQEISAFFQASTDIPGTILFNKSPSGLNATGDHEMGQWNNEVASMQTDYWDPAFDRLDEVLLSAKQGPTGGKIPDEISRKWLPLEEMNEKDEAAARKSVADTDNVYNEMSGGALAQVIIETRFGPDGFYSDIKLPDGFLVKEPEPEPEEKGQGQMDGIGKSADEENFMLENDKMTAANWECPAKASDVAPPGWEGTVQKMKGKVSNPYALSWWMVGQGYAPHS